MATAGRFSRYHWLLWLLFGVLGAITSLVLLIFLVRFLIRRTYRDILRLTESLCEEWRALLPQTQVPDLAPVQHVFQQGGLQQLLLQSTPSSVDFWQLLDQSFALCGYVTTVSCYSVENAHRLLSRVPGMRVARLLTVPRRQIPGLSATAGQDALFGAVCEIQDTSVVLFAGSGTTQSWLDDVAVHQEMVRTGTDTVGIHSGFYHLAETLENAVHETLYELKNRQVLFVGHSLGAALATLTSFWTLLPPGWFAATLTMASPRVGDNAFAQLYAQRVPHHWQVSNRADVVPDLPPSVTPAVGIKWWMDLIPLPWLETKEWVYTHVPGGEITFQDNLGSLAKNHVVAYSNFFRSHLMRAAS